VAINSKEWPDSRNYTLLHEIIHVMLAAGNEEVPAIRERRSGKDWEQLERFAEAATSYALVPEESLRAALPSRPNLWDIPSVRRLARRFRITPLAMATRLQASGLMSWPEYAAWKNSWDAYVATLPPRGGGFAHPVDKAIGRSGRPYVQLVLEALATNRITAVDASRYLDLKFEHFDKLRDSMRATPASGDANE
jgi:hypothetical protein